MKIKMLLISVFIFYSGHGFSAFNEEEGVQLAAINSQSQEKVNKVILVLGDMQKAK